MNKHKRLTFVLSLIVVLSTFAQSTLAQKQTAPAASLDELRIARLAGLARVWGTVKYFHPYLAYRDVDWDKALVEAIPRINGARSAQDYEAALNQMLAVLNDKSTRADIENEAKTTNTQTPPDNARLVRMENGVLIIEAAHIAQAIAKDISALNAFAGKVNEQLPASKGIIIDARSESMAAEIEAYHIDNFLRQTLTSILDSDVVLSAARYRLHNGYAPQSSGGANFYYSALLNSTPKTIAGRSRTKTPPIAFIINQHSPALGDILGGLQSSGRAQVVLEGEPPASDTFTIDLPENVKVRMRTAELVNPDGSIDLQPDITVVKPATADDAALKEATKALQTNPKTKSKPAGATTTQIVQTDKPYADMLYPNVEYRLLALFRFWNVINYFFPYKDLIGDSWETVLQRYIPKFEANKDAVDYQLTVRELITEMHDSHGGVRNANASTEKFGMFLPPVLTGYVERKSVVTKVFDDKLPIKVGDVILAVDGEPIEKKRDSVSRYVSASTQQWLMRNVHLRLLLGPKDSVLKLKLQGANGEVRDVELARSQTIMDPKWPTLMERSTPIVQVLPSGYGYVDLDRLQAGEVDKMFETIKNTPAVIFDMRGYPNGTAWTVAPRLTEKKNVIGALFSRPILEATNLSNGEVADSASYAFSQRLPERQGDVYRGKVVVLINEDAISQAEHTCLFLETATNVTFIGTPTAGANGDVTNMVLPGNLVVGFSGHNVRHADGRQLQRLGIQPHIRVERTIRGVTEGRDEILDAAVKFLQNVSKNDPK
ncbi:MAG TPA: S41 family peptidase [Pyrinomonadaceae bacterium]|nr:S41 family peptidase [Pyrinomonadaceae bacterium]